jgi:hypothetical protein
MARSALIREKFRPRRRHLTAPCAVHFSGSLGLAQAANTAALGAAEKFVASMPTAQAHAALAIAGLEKFVGSLPLTAPANTALIAGYEIAAHYPGRAVISDAAQGGLLALADAALYDVQITESV